MLILVWISKSKFIPNKEEPKQAVVIMKMQIEDSLERQININKLYIYSFFFSVKATRCKITMYQFHETNLAALISKKPLKKNWIIHFKTNIVHYL